MTQEIVPSTLSNPTATPRAVVDPAHARARSRLARRTHEMSAVVAVPLARARAVARAPSARRGAMMTMTAGTSARRISPSLARVAARGRTTTAHGAADATYDTSAHEQLMSGLKGAALNAKEKKISEHARGAVEHSKECFERDTAKSLAYALTSTAITLACGALAYAFVPLQAAYWPVWVAYAFVTGTAATGCWVAAHECGHGAFSDNKTVQDTVGYILHSLLLVPYFSWQRSHAVHHSRDQSRPRGRDARARATRHRGR